MDFDKRSRRKLQEIDKHFARRRRASSPLSTPLPTGLGNSNPAYNFTSSAWGTNTARENISARPTVTNVLIRVVAPRDRERSSPTTRAGDATACVRGRETDASLWRLP